VSEAARFMTKVHDALGPYNLCRLCDPDRCHMYPFIDTLPHGNR
jgi:hypothetical protein